MRLPLVDICALIDERLEDVVAKPLVPNDTMYSRSCHIAVDTYIAAEYEPDGLYWRHVEVFGAWMSIYDDLAGNTTWWFAPPFSPEL